MRPPISTKGFASCSKPGTRWPWLLPDSLPFPLKFHHRRGAFRVDLLTFFLAAAVSRSARFFLVSGLIYYLGPAIKDKVDRYFNQLTILFAVLLVGGFLVLKYVL